MITDYDCRNAFMKVDFINYLIELEKGEKCFESANHLTKIEDFENAYIILYRGVQFIGNALLIKKYNLKSKSKNCQFQYLFENKIISKEIIDSISNFADIRNHIYYNNLSILADITEEEYKERYNSIINIVKILKEGLK